MKTKINSVPIDTARPARSSIEAIFQDAKSSYTDILNNISDGVYYLEAFEKCEADVFLKQAKEAIASLN